MKYLKLDLCGRIRLLHYKVYNFLKRIHSSLISLMDILTFYYLVYEVAFLPVLITFGIV